jgi:hypothetical protein
LIHSVESESALRAHVVALETAMAVTSAESKAEFVKLQEASYFDQQKLLDERSELSALLESVRSQLDKCKSSALEERQKLLDERFDIGCLLAAESEKCENFEVKVLSLEHQLSDSLTLYSKCQHNLIVAEQQLQSNSESFSEEMARVMTRLTQLEKLVNEAGLAPDSAR